MASSRAVVLRGRSAPMSLILDILRATRRTGQGAMVLVTGEAGMGKSALLEVVAAEALGLGFRVGASRADEGTQISPGAPILFALRSGREPLLSATVFADVVGLLGRPSLFAERIREAFAALAAPILLSIDDVHGLDATSHLALRQLIAALNRSPIVWTFSSRDPHDPLVTELSTAAGVEILPLSPLTPADLRSVAEDRFGQDRAQAALPGVAGHPGLAVQLLEGLRVETTEADLPTTFLVDVRRALTRLEPATQRLLQLLAVLGRPVSLAAAQELTDASTRPDVSHQLAGAVREGWLTEVGGELAFRHDAVREAVYATTDMQTRRAEHHRCAHYLLGKGHPALEVVDHVRAWARPGDAAAISILRAAAREAASRFPDTAAELTTEALRMTRPAHPSWPDVAAETIDLLGRVEHAAAVHALVREILARTDDPAFTARILTSAAAVPGSTGSTGLLGSIDQTLSHPEVRGRTRSGLESARALVLAWSAAEAVARPTAQAALEGARELDDPHGTLLALRALGEINRRAGFFDRSLADSTEALNLSEPAERGSHIMALLTLDRFDQAQTMLNTAESDFGQGTLHLRPSLVRSRMWHGFHTARFDVARTSADWLVRFGHRHESRSVVLEATMIAAAITLIQGRVDEAHGHLRSALGTNWPSPEDEAVLPDLRVLHAWLSLAEGQISTTVTHFTRFLDSRAQHRGHLPRDPWWLRILTRAAVESADEILGRAAISITEGDALRNPGVTRLDGLARQARSLIVGDLNALERAWELLNASPRPLVRADVNHYSGRLLMDNGRRIAGQRRLQVALGVYRAVGDRPESAAVQTLLTKGPAGRSKPGRATLGWDSLTDTERRVALLVSSGQTNRAAAGELGLSPNTVSTHLRSIFGKLQVRSRVQLANLVNERSAVR